MSLAHRFGFSLPVAAFVPFAGFARRLPVFEAFAVLAAGACPGEADTVEFVRSQVVVT
jgi:hypothetical protein